MVDSNVSVKSFIVDELGRLLIIQRALDEVQKPGIWEIPGGRLGSGEDTLKGLIRETKEETNIDVEVLQQLNMRNFVRDDGQRITMFIFLCKPLNKLVRLSGEHSAFEWLNMDQVKGKISAFYDEELRLYKELL